MLSTFARNWWLLALRGGLGIVFGVMVFFWPMLAWVVVVATFAAFALIDGFLALMTATSGQEQGRPSWGLILQGVLGISAAAIAILWPGITQLALLFLIAFWAIATGLFQVIAAIRLRQEIEGEWALALGGILSMAFGFVAIAMPVAGALAIAWLIAAYSIAYGILLLTLGLRLRSFGAVRVR
jgi:uncharacterized membrane protein HdeD (DUF308 family)